jgi:outer membrane receptor protein involved in Fe transport
MRRAHARVAIAAAAMALMPQFSGAQESPAVTSEALQEVIVTGSRIPRPMDEATGPITVIDALDLARLPADSIGEILQRLPLQNGATMNTNVNVAGDGSIRGDGSTRINLRGLGPERTLVLLNGRRFVFGGLGGDASVDLNTIPSSMIERIEISPSGASAIYGADAVAGVVNIITRRDYSGLDVGTDYKLTERGDGAVRSVHALAGFDIDRGNLMFGAEFSDQDAVNEGRRDYSAHVESLLQNGTVVDTGSLFTAEGFIQVPANNTLGLAPNFYTRVAGSSGQSAADYRLFNPLTDQLNYAPYGDLQTPAQRGSLWLMAHRALTDSIEWFTEALEHLGTSQQVFLPVSYTNFATGAAPVDASGAQVIPQNNFYNPFGADVPGILRAMLENGSQVFREQSTTQRILSGLRGDVDHWHWEGSLSWARSDTRYFQSNQILQDRIRLAVGPSGRAANGSIVCGTPDPLTGIVPSASIIPGCVPLDLFDGQGRNGSGSITRDQINYINADLTNRGYDQQLSADIALSGPLGRLPAGSVKWSFGAEYRRESAGVTLDPLTQQGIIGDGGGVALNQNSFSVGEAFVEAEVPLLAGAPGARALDASLGARYSHYSNFGDTTPLQAGLRWNIVRALTVRGSYAQVFRAPGTLDLFAQQAQVLDYEIDPCGNNPSPAQRRNCVAAGVPGGSYAQAAEPYPVYTGGNPQLAPESGSTWTAGALLQLREFDALQASLDFWRIRLDHAIGSVDDATIINDCADSGSPDACRLITRHADGSIASVDAQTANLTRYTVRGIDLSLSASQPLGHGVVAAHLSATYLGAFDVTQFQNGTSSQIAGTYDADTEVSWPRWRAQATLDWLLGPWMLSYSGHYIDSFRECGDKNPALFDVPFFTAQDCRTVESRVFHDLSASYRFASGVRLTAAVENLFDTDPPRINLSPTDNTDPSIYPLLGRSYAVRVLYSF